MIESTITADRSDDPVEYPYIGVSDLGSIILFSGPGVGTLLKQGHGLSFAGNVPIGNHSNSWAEAGFKRFNGVISLSNKWEGEAT